MGGSRVAGYRLCGIHKVDKPISITVSRGYGPRAGAAIWHPLSPGRQKPWAPIHALYSKEGLFARARYICPSIH